MAGQSLGGGTDPQTDLNVRLCEVLGLNPEQTTSVRVDVRPAGAVVEWAGRRNLSPEALEELVDVLRDDSRRDELLRDPAPWT